MVKVSTKPFDPAEFIETPEDVAIFLSDALESGDPAVVAAALGVIVRKQGTSDIARKTGLSRASLYNALREEGNPTLATLLKVVDAANLHLTARTKTSSNTIPIYYDRWDLGVAA